MASDGNGFFKGFLMGGAIGAVIALLYAPKSGKEMREDLKRKTEELLEEADKGVAGASKSAAEIVAEGRRKAEALRKEAEELMADAKKRAKEVLAEGKAKASTETDVKLAGAKRKTHQTKRSVRQRTGKAKKAVGAFSEKKGTKTNDAE